MGIDELHGFLIMACKVEKCGIFQFQVFSCLHHIKMFLHLRQPLCVGFAKTFVELVKLHVDAGICLVELKGLLHITNGFFCLMLFIEI